MTAVKISEIPYSATNPMAIHPTTVTTLISLLSRERPEGEHRLLSSRVQYQSLVETYLVPFLLRSTPGTVSYPELTLH